MFSSRFSPAFILLACCTVIGLGLCLRTAKVNRDDSDWNVPPRAARAHNPIPANDDSIAAGKAVYMHQCRSCHGDGGCGDGPRANDLDPDPGDLTAPSVSEQSDGALFWKITQGRKPMPSFEELITEPERWQTINFIRTLAAPTTKPTTHY